MPKILSFYDDNEEYNILPEGEYLVKLIDYDEDEATARGYNDEVFNYEKITLKFEVRKPKKYKNRIVWFSSASDISRKSNRLRKLLLEILDDEISEIDLDDLIGVKCWVKIRHNEVNDRTYANIVSAKPYVKEE